MPEAEHRNEIGVPLEVFDRLVETEDLPELKAILFVLRFSGPGGTRVVPAPALRTPEVSRAIAGPNNPEPGEQRSQRAVDRAVTNGALLRITSGTGEQRQQYLLPATEGTRALVERIRADDPEIARAIGLPSEDDISIYRPNVYAFYEQHLGPLTPIVADQLRDAERSYPRLWIEEAIIAAADANTRSWRYIESILTRWEVSGAPGGSAGRS